MRERPALFLDRDGVVNEPVWDHNTSSPESPLRQSDVILVEGAAVALRRVNDAGLPIILISNQPAAAKMIVSEATLHEVHARVLDLLRVDSVLIESSYVCLHHPDGVDPSLTSSCLCRKPAPGMLLQAGLDLDLDLAASWMIGDTDADFGAARAAGLAGVVLIAHPLSAHRRTALSESADACVPTIAAAIDLALSRIL